MSVETPKKKYPRTRSHIPHKSVKCAGHLSSDPSKPCGSWAVRGGTVCPKHGGGKQMLPVGDPGRGGRVPVTRVNTSLPAAVYSASLTEELKKIYDAADLFGMEQEVRLGCAHLEWAVQQWQKDPTGGVALSTSTRTDESGATTTLTNIKPWTEIVMEHVDKVRRLKNARWNALNNAQIAKEVDALIAKAIAMTTEAA